MVHCTVTTGEFLIGTYADPRPALELRFSVPIDHITGSPLFRTMLPDFDNETSEYWIDVLEKFLSNPTLTPGSPKAPPVVCLQLNGGCQANVAMMISFALASIFTRIDRSYELAVSAPHNQYMLCDTIATYFKIGFFRPS